MKLGILAAALASVVPAALAAAPVDPRVYADLHWRQLGPYRAGWASVITGVPTKPDTFYFGAAGGGVWRTDDAGRTWTSLFDKGPSSAIGAIAVAPSNPEVIYVGAGQPEPRYDVESGRGVYRSSDGGKTWTDLGLHDTRYIGDIWVSPTDPNLVLVAAVGHFFGPNPERGIFRSTDGGKTWSHVLAPGEWTGAADIVSDPANPQILFASTWEARQWPWQSYFTEISGPGSGLYRSDDGGVHWRRVTGEGWPAGPLGRISLAATRKGGALRLYAVVDSKTHGGLWRSDDGAAHWRLVNPEKAFANYYFSRVIVDPRNPDVTYMVGQSMRRCTGGGEHCVIFRGSPGGDDYHQIWINPLHPERMAEGSDQGAAVSVNGARTWSDWYNQPTGQLYHLAADNRFPYWVYSGQQDSGTVAIASRSDYGQLTLRDWHPVGGDERDYDIPDPLDPNIVYGSGLGGHVSRWDARTGTVADVSAWPVFAYGARPTLVKHHFNWVTPLVASRAGAPALYLGGEVVFRSLDRGDHWTIISPDLTGKTAGAQRCGGDVAIADAMACGYGTIVTIQPSPKAAGEVWVGTDTGLVQVTRDGGGHWTQLPLPVKPWSKISSIDQSASDPATAYVAVDAQRLDDYSPHVFKTHDGGRSWQAIGAGLPPDRVVSVVRADPVRPGLLYAGTGTGAFVSFDDGASWQPLQQNLPTAWARDLLVHGDDLIAATQGRAIWVLGDLALLRQLPASAASEPAHLFTPAAAYRVRFNNNRDTPLAPETPVGENPPQGAIIDYWLGAAPRQPVTLEIRNSAGEVVRRFSSADKPKALNADRYFAEEWTRPTPVLGAAPGKHRWIWDLREDRPAAVEYNYSIAAVLGTDTPLLPEGQLVPPGRYTAVLDVDDRAHSASFDVLPDPRVSGADYAAAEAFSRSLAGPMAKAWRGYAETEAVRKELAKRIARITDPTLLSEARALAAKLEPSDVPNSGFAGESGTLAALETAAEGSDFAPSAAMRSTAAETIAAIDAEWNRWQQVRAADLDSLNRGLAAARLAPVLVPGEAELAVPAAGGGGDLP
ncbi:MAG: WD40/YVTN/BNR-like repeat-containing protein [Sphingomonas sp.]